ncbi:MAG: hypothetical protein K9J13_15100, partial [Saprospiraceae bacterium]|nr:hypothetical protein [Saprospiraceae bacterium]
MKKTLLFILIIFPIALSAQLSGTYTIGTNGNYSTFTAAVSALTTSGINGPVVFYVDSGTYNEQITIPVISGSSSINTISFIGATGDSTDAVITYAPTSSSNNFTVKLNTTNNIIFKHLTFKSNGIFGLANVMVISGVNTSIKISNCRFIGVQCTFSTYSNSYLLDIDYTTTSLQNMDIKITNSYFFEGGAGIYLKCSSGLSFGIEISNNIIKDQFRYGIYTAGKIDVLISYNNLTNSSSYSSLNGIFCGSHANITCNIIENSSGKCIEIYTY